MKYLVLLVFGSVALLLLNELVFKHQGPVKLNSLGARLKDLGTRFHLTIGVMAVLIVLYLLARLLLGMMEQH
ncbi:MAG: hypothetical protein HY913_11625 [Desulfomonile tiedjei]|nr:hypothetical protein [Desulfomonile tiedjei]